MSQRTTRYKTENGKTRRLKERAKPQGKNGARGPAASADSENTPPDTAEKQETGVNHERT